MRMESANGKAKEAEGIVRMESANEKAMEAEGFQDPEIRRRERRSRG